MSPLALLHRGITGADGTLSAAMRRPDPASAERASAGASCGPLRPLIIASMLREEGITGVHTHVRQLRQYLGGVEWTPRWSRRFPGLRALAVPVFGLRRVVERASRAAGVVWYRYWHEVFLYHARCGGDSLESATASCMPRTRRRRELHEGTAGAAPTGRPGRPLPDLTIGRVGRQGADHTWRDRVPADSEDGT